MAVGISPDEHAARRERLRAHCSANGLSGYVLFDEHLIRYFAGFTYLATERPVAFVGTTQGDELVFVPEFEVERIQAETAFGRIESYVEYPGREHPMHVLARVLDGLGMRAPVGASSDGYPGILGYSGPPLSEAIGGDVAPLGEFAERLLVRKSAAEIELIRESGRWCAYAHRLLQRYSTPGTTEADASLRAAHEATVAMARELGGSYGQQASSDGASAGYRGQIGRRSAWAHAVAHAIEFRPGDVLVSETSAPVHGYNAELERAMVIGEPTGEMEVLFGHMLGARQVAFDTLRPGVTCAEVDGAVLAYFEEHDLLPYWKQHTGHAIGLRNHEAPFLDVGDHTPVEAGMVFTIEPGVYDSSLGGFRHSDTVAVTPDGIDVLTDYPTALDELTIL
ncbi:MAG TPA: Xaa-Pro peptidase family protein [Gaiellaceae bacterium]|nr:Xaa-Pro peptidase family protein [Gaiellaceae bacterium]